MVAELEVKGDLGNMATSVLECSEDAFRKLFKFYKQRRSVTELKDVLDFACPDGKRVFKAQLIASSVSDQDATRAGLYPVKQWKAYCLHGYPGFIFISNPFLPWSQRYWVKQCLKMYPQKPNVCNLDMHMSPEETTDIWGKSMLHMRQKGSSKRESKCLLEKLRWVTLGYHYDWNTKTYSAEHYTPFPSDLAFLSEQVTAACGFQGFTAQAGILNYYHFDSSLGIHVDESELDHSKPLLSFSFGQSSIFLLGGLKREDMPIAMLMHSGDIMIMSGFSRLLYHAVPRIISNPEGCPVPRCLEPAICTDSVTADSTLWCDEADWEICASYLKNSRINMTVRQVLADGQVFPSSGNKTNVIQPGSYYSEDVNKEEYGAKRQKTDEIVDVHTQIDS